MLNGICVLPVIPMRETQSDKSEMINQILFGETFVVLEKKHKWSYIKLSHDNYQGWIDNKQFKFIKNTDHKSIVSTKKQASIKINSIRQNLPLGGLIPLDEHLRQEINIAENLRFHDVSHEKWFPILAKKYLNSPYMWGGRTPNGIDCSGYTQMVYRFFNIKLPRDSKQQSQLGKKLNNNLDAQLGDLAFFGKKKSINHVGIILKRNKIIHASGKVRIDLLDTKGIFNTETNTYSHQLRFIKRFNIFN
ncbi:MAG: hydrolase Nlp/P60 [Flavobacteriales bacterium]|nr:hydrolase Nlp/P60 [Flavobacteriales bacterium]|tara:strand:- start:3856 stop:4599 length:744 start_codon:yes stop_codon:yes gene_type:complete